MPPFHRTSEKYSSQVLECIVGKAENNASVTPHPSMNFSRSGGASGPTSDGAQCGNLQYVRFALTNLHV
jgi:hypothetical protein